METPPICFPRKRKGEGRRQTKDKYITKHLLIPRTLKLATHLTSWETIQNFARSGIICTI